MNPALRTVRTGFAQLPLHHGKAPAWLFSRMTRLAREITGHIAAEYGSDEMLRRLAEKIEALKRLAQVEKQGSVELPNPDQARATGAASAE